MCPNLGEKHPILSCDFTFKKPSLLEQTASSTNGQFLRCAMKTLKMSQEQERKRMEDLSFWSEL
jgi:hypothetical protein